MHIKANIFSDYNNLNDYNNDIPPTYMPLLTMIIYDYLSYTDQYENICKQGTVIVVYDTLSHTPI